MLVKVIEERGMSFSPSPLTDMGNISEGQRTRTESYNYPLTSSALGDAPTYTSMSETWTRDGVNTDSATTNFAVNEISSPRTVEITLPNGTKSKQYSYNHPGQFDDGLVYLDETRDASGALLQSSTSTWELGDYNSPRPTQVQATNNEISQTTATTSSKPVITIKSLMCAIMVMVENCCARRAPAIRTVPTTQTGIFSICPQRLTSMRATT